MTLLSKIGNINIIPHTTTTQKVRTNNNAAEISNENQYCHVIIDVHFVFD